MARFAADLVLTFEMKDMADGGRRLHELATAVAQFGFEMRSAEVRVDQPDDRPGDGWTSYAPLQDGSQLGPA
jgi:hypothetical protein